MDRTEAFQILGIEFTKDEKAVKNAYRNKLTVTNPEDDAEGFKLLRRAYEEACRYARETEEALEEKPRDTTPSGLWLERAAGIYSNIRTRQDTGLWKALFDDDTFLSLEEEENCRLKLLGFLMEHYKLPTAVWKLFDRKLSILKDAKALREKFPANFMHFIIGRCERGEDLEFGQFEGAEDADYDQFLEYYDRCWQALQEKKPEEAARCLESADKLGIRHPVMEVCRATLYIEQGRREEAVALLEGQLEKYPGDGMLCYNFAELLWASREDKAASRERAARLYQELKAGNDSHYMANVRLTEWYYDQGKYREAKKCAEKVLAAGSDDAFMELLAKINAQIEKELEARYRQEGSWEPALELCWCYLQDGRIARGIRLAVSLEKRLPAEKEAEYNGLLAKLYVEQAEYEDSISMTQYWETSLKEKMEKRADPDEEEEKKDRDRLRQAHLIRMQCYHNLGFKDRENFALAVREGESILAGDMKDVGVLLEMAQIYTEMEEYEQSLEISGRLVDEFQVFAAHASALEAYRRQLNAGGVVREASQCIRYFPSFVKSYEYLAKVYLDLDRREDFRNVMEDAEKNGVKSVLLDAYRFQMENKPMDISELNTKLKEFRRNYFKHVEDGEKSYYELGLPILTEYLYHYPDDFMLVERAIFHRAAHCHEAAREDFEKALYINPANPYALNGLSFVHKYLGEYERALFYIKKAVLYLDKEMSMIIHVDTGNLYALLGIPEMALASYRLYESLTGECNKSWFGNRMAEYTMRTGRTEEAAKIYERYLGKDRKNLYKKLVELYIGAGEEEKARQALRQWGDTLQIDSARFVLKALHDILSASSGTAQDAEAGAAYYCDKGWIELAFGEKKAAVRAFARMFRGGPAEDAMEEKVCDAVFACILCGNEKKGKRYAKWLQKWLSREKAAVGNKYYNREKRHLQLEFLASYYTESPQKLQEILNRESRCEICHHCTTPLCRELEGVRVLLMLRTGRREEAAQRVRRNLEVQFWDEYMLSIKHIEFNDKL